MPDSFRVEGLEAFEKALSSFASRAEREVGEWVKNYALTLTYNLVMETPQYSGAAASAWRVSVGSPEYIAEKPYFIVPTSGPGIGDAPYSRANRNMQAVNEALALCSFEIGMFSLKDGDMYISNGLPYTGWFEIGQYAPGKALRTENLPQRGVAQTVRDSLDSHSVLRF